MNLIRFTFANIFDFKSVMDRIKKDIHKDINLYEPSCFHSSNMDKLIIIFSYFESPRLAFKYVNSICTPTAIEDHMNKPYIIIQCLNYFEYMNFKDRFKDMYFNYSDSTYTVKLFDRYDIQFLLYLKQHAPTANITQVSFRNGRATYIKLKD